MWHTRDAQIVNGLIRKLTGTSGTMRLKTPGKTILVTEYGGFNIMDIHKSILYNLDICVSPLSGSTQLNTENGTQTKLMSKYLTYTSYQVLPIRVYRIQMDMCLLILKYKLRRDSKWAGGLPSVQ